MWKEKALELKQQGIELKEIMYMLNVTISYKAFQKALWRYENKGTSKVIYEDKKAVPGELDIEEYYNKLKDLDRMVGKLDTKQTRTTITINDNKPIGIAFSGDWHIGAKGIDYDQFDKDRETIQETEGLYVIGTGDYKDNQNALVHGPAVNESIASPGMQDILVLKMMKEISHSILALIRGCHDDWDKKVGDKDFIETLCSEIERERGFTGPVNLWHGGILNIKLGDQQYKIFARHKYKNESSLNTTNSQKHFPDMQMLDRMGKKVIYLRSGSYKKYDEFGQKLAGYEGKKSIPVVVIYPDEHKVVPFQELEDAIVYLKAVREDKTTQI